LWGCSVLFWGWFFFLFFFFLGGGGGLLAWIKKAKRESDDIYLLWQLSALDRNVRSSLLKTKNCLLWKEMWWLRNSELCKLLSRKESLLERNCLGEWCRWVNNIKMYKVAKCIGLRCLVKDKVKGFCVYKGREFLASSLAVSLSDSIWYHWIVFEWFCLTGICFVFGTHRDCPSCSFTHYEAPECWYLPCGCVVRSGYNDCNEL
jgi:hypothetical protein